MMRPYTGLSDDGIERAITAVADQIAQYLENETVLAKASPEKIKLRA